MAPQQWHPAMARQQWRPAMACMVAPSNGTPAMSPSNGAEQWHPAIAPSNGIQREPRQSWRPPPLLLEVRTPIAKAIWGRKTNICFVLKLPSSLAILSHRLAVVAGSWSAICHQLAVPTVGSQLLTSSCYVLSVALLDRPSLCSIQCNIFSLSSSPDRVSTLELGYPCLYIFRGNKCMEHTALKMLKGYI